MLLCCLWLDPVYSGLLWLRCIWEALAPVQLSCWGLATRRQQKPRLAQCHRPSFRNQALGSQRERQHVLGQLGTEMAQPSQVPSRLRPQVLSLAASTGEEASMSSHRTQEVKSRSLSRVSCPPHHIRSREPAHPLGRTLSQHAISCLKPLSKPQFPLV